MHHGKKLRHLFRIRGTRKHYSPRRHSKCLLVVNVEEEHTGFIEETGLERRIIHIHLDERDLRSKEWHDLHLNGFTEEHCINDFPIRDRKVVLHVRRRRWKDKNGKNVVLPHESLTALGTSYSKEFADVLKKIFGHIPDSGPLSGAIL